MIKRLIRFNIVVVTLAVMLMTVQSALSVTDTATLTLDVNAGALTTAITNASVDLGDVTYSFSSQNLTDVNLGTVDIVDLRGSSAGWTGNWQGADWTSGGSPTLDYDGDGSATGQLCIDYNGTFDENDVTVNAGTDDRSAWDYGVDDCFDSGTANISFITAGSTEGDGDYTVVTNVVLLDQFIPAQQATENYSMVLTLDVS